MMDWTKLSVEEDQNAWSGPTSMLMQLPFEWWRTDQGDRERDNIKPHNGLLFTRKIISLWFQQH